MIVGLMLGFKCEVCVCFFFLLFILVILGVGFLVIFDLFNVNEVVDWYVLFYGVVFLFVSVYFCIYLFLSWILCIGMLFFVIYCLVLGVILLWFVFV